VRVAVVGTGVVARVAVRHLLASPLVESVTVAGRHLPSLAAAADFLGRPRRLHTVAYQGRSPRSALDGHDVAVVAVGGPFRPTAAAALERGMPVVAACDDPGGVRDLLGLDGEARRRNLPVVVGACLAPGLSCLLAAKAAAALDRVDEIHVASFGTGGPACARRHHAALSSLALDWHDGEWRRMPGGSGRELVYFPEPVGGADCYRAALPDPLLLVPAFPEVKRVTARLQATRRDRMTSWLPMLRPPHPEGTVGAVRADVRGWRDGRPAECILGTVVRPALGAGLVAALAAIRAGTGSLRAAGAGGLAELVADPGPFLADLAGAGVRPSVFEGSLATDPAPAWGGGG
jgi:saccharopine dehydrogenase-like NADP-dependent oxidoreductase